jgi:hypothetical protein
MKKHTPLRYVVAALALVLTSNGLAAQQARVPADPTTVPELKPEFDRATKLGLPIDALVASARKGYLLAVSTNKIREALRERTDRLVAAREALKPVQSNAELEAGANALQSSIPERELRELRRVAKGRSLEVPIGVLEELVASGVSPKQAADNVKQMISKNVADVHIASLGTFVQGDVASGLAPSLALDVRSKGVLSLPQAAATPLQVAPNSKIPPR